MLGNKKAVANVAVKDLDVATKFYENTLGLTPVHEEKKELVVFRSGTSEINRSLVDSRSNRVVSSIASCSDILIFFE